MNACRISNRTVGARCVAWVLAVGGLAVLTGCPPTPTPEQSALAGTWVFLTSAVDTEITQFSVVVDSTGTPTSVTYQLGTATPTTMAVQGTAGLSGALATVNLTFGDNTFSLSGTLDGSETSMAGFVSLRLQVAPVTITLARTLGTLTRSTTPQAGQADLTGTWTLSVPSTQLYEVYLAFNTLGDPNLVTTKIGINPARTDIAPTGSGTATTDGVTLDVKCQGAVSAQDTFQFTGQFSADSQDVLEGTASLRVSAAETTIVIQNASATLVKATSSGTVSLEGTWALPADLTGLPTTSPAITDLRLQFGATNLLTVLTYTIDNGTPVTVPGSAAQTQFDGAFVTVRAAFANDYLIFSGAINSDQTALLGYLTAGLGGAAVSQQPIIFVKQ